MIYVFAFFGMVVLDFVWGRYTKAIADRKLIAGSIYAVGTVIGGAYLVIGYTDNHWLLIPVGLGAFVGTFLSIKYGD